MLESTFFQPAVSEDTALHQSEQADALCCRVHGDFEDRYLQVISKIILNVLTSSNRQRAASYSEHRPLDVRVGSLHWLRSAEEP